MPQGDPYLPLPDLPRAPEPTGVEEELVEEDAPLTAEARVAIHEAWMVEIRQRVKDLEAGREVVRPWDEAMNVRIFGKRR
jgi:hypothetical protein